MTLLSTFMSTCEVPEPGGAIICGFRLTDTPEGWPEAVSRIAWLKLPFAVVTAFDAPEAPCWMLTDEGLAITVKLGDDDFGGLTFRLDPATELL